MPSLNSNQTHFEVAGGIVFNPSRQILLVTNQIGTITFPKGPLEDGESYEAAATREVLEESGLRYVTLLKELGWIYRQGYKTERSHTRSVTKSICMFMFLTQETKLNPLVDDIIKAEWVNPIEVPDLLHWAEEAKFYNGHLQELKF